jgi:hypothetical protein
VIEEEFVPYTEHSPTSNLAKRVEPGAWMTHYYIVTLFPFYGDSAARTRFQAAKGEG